MFLRAITLSARLVSQVKISKRSLFVGSALNMKVGDKLPNVNVFEGTPKNPVNMAELFAGKKGILIGIPGAFTPGCSKTHVPGYVENFDKIKAKGVDIVACISVNDPFVMEAFGKSQGAEGKVRMLADSGAAFTKAIEMDLDLSAALGTVRSKRYSMLIEDGVVKQINLEPDNTGTTCSLAPEILNQI